MKKRFVTLFFALLVVISATFVEAADVPSFYQVGGRHLTFTGKEIGKYKPMRVYGYDCDIDLDEDFAEQYLSDLMNHYNFEPIGHYINDFTRGRARLYERWIFVYTGSKSISTFEHKNVEKLKSPYYCNLVVGRSKDWNTGITHFSVWIANGLTYGED